jgi:hypothetical protein
MSVNGLGDIFRFNALSFRIDVATGKAPKFYEYMGYRGYERSQIIQWFRLENPSPIPDTAVGLIVRYLDREQMSELASLFIDYTTAKGVRELFHYAIGYTPQSKKDFQKQLSEYISEQPRVWERFYPESYFEQFERVYGYPRKSNVANHFTGVYIYNWFPRGIREKLNLYNPINPDKLFRDKCQHQFFTGELRIVLLQHITTVTEALAKSSDIEEFKSYMKKVPKIGQKYLKAS